jgi:hypothetical protein
MAPASNLKVATTAAIAVTAVATVVEIAEAIVARIHATDI